MKIGMVTDSLGHLPYAEMLNTAAALGISGVEFNACNWTSAPHFNLAGLLKDGALRNALQVDLKARNLELMALSANGNQRDPVEGSRQVDSLYDTIRVAGDLW